MATLFWYEESPDCGFISPFLSDVLSIPKAPVASVKSPNTCLRLGHFYQNTDRKQWEIKAKPEYD
jgi:hypothetical protein